MARCASAMDYAAHGHVREHVVFTGAAPNLGREPDQ